MATTVQKWGNSLGIRVPKALAEQLDLTAGTQVELEANGNSFTVRPIKRQRRKRKYKLADLLKQVKEPFPHKELFPGPPVGKELI